jgi:ERO1-like protein alpha
MNKICKSKSCSVCRCDEKDIPFFWSSTDPATRATNNKNLWGIERQLTESEWVWHVEDLPNDKGEYFDIFRNVESFTNYNGSYIWQLIYQENCFHSKDNSDICAEERILY